MSQAPGSRQFAFEVVRGRSVGQRYAFPAEGFVVGNAPGGGPAINLEEQEGASPRRMAGRQIEVKARGGQVEVRDLDSPGGTFVNRRRLLPNTAATLGVGDLLQLGGVQLKLVEQAGRRTADSSRSPAAAPSSRPAPSETAANPARPPSDARKTPSPKSQPREPSKPTRPAATGRAPSKPTVTPKPNRAPAGGAKTASIAYTLTNGTVLKSWDDFLTVSAQRWGLLAQELASGRLASYVKTIGRADLTPPGPEAGSVDERLDAWLKRLPTSKPVEPELDVHPSSLSLKALPGGRTTHRLRIANIGYGLLRARLSVEPQGTPWLAIEPRFGRDFPTVEETEAPFTVSAPDPFDAPLQAEVVVTSNGGTIRVPTRLEPAGSEAHDDFEPSAAAPTGGGLPWPKLWSFLARRSALERIAGGAALGFGIRCAILVANGFQAEPTLPGPAALFGGLLALALSALAAKRGALTLLPAVFCSTAVLGVFVAAGLIAVCQAIEPALGPLARAAWAVVPLWTALGAVLGAATWLLAPPNSNQGGQTS